MVVSTSVELDDITQEIAKAFDYTLTGSIQTNIHDIPDLLGSYSLGLIVGSSGSGKSTLLKRFGSEATVEWDSTRAVVSHFESAADAKERLTGVGLNTIPTWIQPFHTLSTGEKYRATLARALSSESVIDEFTSVVDRNTARSLAYSLQRYVRSHNLEKIVLASPHKDITAWLMPDWVYDTDTLELSYPEQARPEITLDLVCLNKKDKADAWRRFSKHHYLSADLNASARCYLVMWEGQTIGFTSSLRMPNPNIKRAWREHRTVVLPSFQGLGIGTRLPELVGDLHLAQGHRFFSKTGHPRVGQHREESKRWRATAKNLLSRTDVANRLARGIYSEKGGIGDFARDCYSHEHIGSVGHEAISLDLANTKICVRCERQLPSTTDFFYSHGRTKDGGLKLRPECKACKRGYQKRVYREK